MCCSAQGNESLLLLLIIIYLQTEKPAAMQLAFLLLWISPGRWCARGDSNPYAKAMAPKTIVSTNSTTGAYSLFQGEWWNRERKNLPGGDTT